jgi:tetratricopeptide (TPR) repeat protein
MTTVHPARRRAVFQALLVAAGLAGAIALQAARDRWYPTLASPVADLYFTSGDAVGRMALSYKSVLADVYWIRAVQYFGSTRLAERAGAGRRAIPPHGRYDLLYPLLDVTTTLDPRFNIAYRFGAVFLSEGYPNGPGRPDLAIALLDKGFAANPDRWQYLYDKAFVYYWTLQDYQQAARWFTEAARIDGAPEWLPGIAAATLAAGGDRQNARRLWQQIYDTADQQYLRDNARFHLLQLEVAEVADRLTGLLEAYARRTGTRPDSFRPLMAAGLLREEPRDPDGLPFVVNPETGRAELDPQSRYAIRPFTPFAPPDAQGPTTDRQ